MEKKSKLVPMASLLEYIAMTMLYSHSDGSLCSQLSPTAADRSTGQALEQTGAYP